MTFAWPLTCTASRATLPELLVLSPCMLERGACSLSRAFSTQAPAAPVAEKTTFGGLKDEDRIFQNIYGKHDLSIKVGACLRP